ncbi:hypothetical protein [Fredinandcohnia quinoae]|uniref:DUF3592 domain-containing protein n=1 Tax=Fredinandcohnia quinoae TaxID=2918902 RepID=A0AAW5E455_9BACI|nr:hypothetical protein [Fredinandcohnia sp. SECRCQ15]MCH1627721.1 hypothetical protein [Fredinandcohnia sp. SECRCQ15]
MKKTFILLIACLLIHTASANALSWAYWFVVHNGKVYEVKEDIPLNKEELDGVIGKVETKADEYSGKYSGNASNYYEIGTRYYEIAKVSKSEAIAVEIQPNKYVKADYVHDSPSQIKNIIFNMNTWVILGIGFIIFLTIVVVKSEQS